MSVVTKFTSADATRIEFLTIEAQRKRDFAAQLREEAIGLWAADYLALAEQEDAKADAIEAELKAHR